MKWVMKRCIMMVCAAVLFCAVTACDGERYITSAETENVIGDATLDSLMFSLDGVVYTLPVHFSELEANGWIPNDSTRPKGSAFATDILEFGESDGWGLTLGDQIIVVGLTNLSEEVLPLSECYITDVTVLFEKYDAKLILPGNIMIGSTNKDVIAAYGEPSEKLFLEDRINYFYSSDYFYLQINIDNETNFVTLMSYSR